MNELQSVTDIDEVIKYTEREAEGCHQMASAYHTDEGVYLQEETLFMYKEILWENIHEWLEELKELRKKRPHGEWIPCSERLPSYSERIVLATVVRRDKTWNNDPYHRLVTYINGKWYPVPQSINLVPSHMVTIEQSDGGQAEVIAWMTLPEPYKKEGETREE